MPDVPLSRQDWTIEFYAELKRIRPDLEHSGKFIAAIAQSEWSRKGRPDDPREAARAWNARVKSANT